MSKLIMLIGCPGSGKSTWVNNYLKTVEIKPIILSTDDILEEWGKEEGLNYTQAFNKFEFSKVEHEFNKRFAMAIANKDDIIIDQTNMSIKSRAKKLKKVSNYIKTAIVFTVDYGILVERLKNRQNETGKSIPEHVVKNMINSYQEPTYDEFDDIKFI